MNIVLSLFCPQSEVLSIPDIEFALVKNPSIAFIKSIGPGNSKECPVIFMRPWQPFHPLDMDASITAFSIPVKESDVSKVTWNETTTLRPLCL